MEFRRSVYDDDVVMFVSDSNDSELGADIEVRDEQDLNASLELPVINTNRNNDFRTSFMDYDYEIEDPLHDEIIQYAELEHIQDREDLNANNEESNGSTQLYTVPNEIPVQIESVAQSASIPVQIESMAQSTSIPIQIENVAQSISVSTKENSPSKVKVVDFKTTDVNATCDDDGMICTICFEAWTCSGEHRLVSLRCGHLYGRKCIAKWIKNRDAKCPQCNSRVKKADIRPIYAKIIKTLDTTERDYAIREFEKESILRKKSELMAARRKMECDILRVEVEGLKKELMMLQSQLKEARTGSKQYPKSTSQISTGNFSRIHQLDLKASGCRVMDCSSILGMVAVSQPSTNALFPGHGLRKIKLPDMSLCEFVHVHNKPIKDISFRRTDGCILTASLDKSVKLINFLNNTIVQTYNLECDVWSCCWDTDDANFFYAGVSSGIVYKFDLRMTDRFLCQLPNSGERSPVVSLQYLQRQHPAKVFKCGPIAGQLGSCHFYERDYEYSNAYIAKPLPLEGRFTSLSVEPTTGHLLASCRPSTKHPQVTHTLCELSCGLASMCDFSCNFVHSVNGGRTQAQLTRSKLMLHPDNDDTVLVCAGDEESKSAMVWNGCTGSLINKLPAESPILDVTTFRWDKPVLATLSDKSMYFYKWT